MNICGIFFLDHPIGVWSLTLGIAGMLPNLIIMWKEKGLSKAMALPHLIPWTFLVIWLLSILTGPEPPTGTLAIYTWALVSTNTCSLIFDYLDAYKWWRGDRVTA